MQKYFYFWIFFIVISAIIHGYKNYKENKMIKFHGGFKEIISCTITASLGLIFSPVFLLIETIKFIPAAIILYFIY